MTTETEKGTTRVTEEKKEAEKTVATTPVYAVVQGQVLSRQEALEWDSK